MNQTTVYRPSVYDPARPLPGSEQLDKLVLSCMMQRPENIQIVRDTVKASDFFTPHCAMMFDIIIDRHDAGMAVDCTALASYLLNRDRITEIGGMHLLVEIETAAPLPSQAATRTHCAELKQAAGSRKMITLGMQVAELGFANADNRDTDLADVVSELERIRENVTTDVSVPIRQTVQEWIADYLSPTRDPRDQPVTTGINALDQLFDGGVRREAYLIGAKTGHGKTLISMQIAGNLAIAGRRGLIVGYEMTRKQILQRDIARESDVHLGIVMHRREGDTGDYEEIIAAVDRIAEWDVHTIDKASTSLQTVCAEARRLHRLKPLDFMVVDYLQIIPREHRRDQRTDQLLDWMMVVVKSLQKEIGCTLIVPVQLNDDGLIRDCRTIENHVENNMRIEMDVAEDDEGNEVILDAGRIRILKNRYGPSNRIINISKHGATQRFTDAAPKESPPPSPKKNTWRAGRTRNAD